MTAIFIFHNMTVFDNNSYQKYVYDFKIIISCIQYHYTMPMIVTIIHFLYLIPILFFLFN